MGLILAIETATADGSVAVRDGDVVEVRELGEQRNHAKNLATTVQTLIAGRFEDIDGYALSIGPGSFTGLRVGLAFLKGLAAVVPRPVVPVSTLEVMAAGIFHHHPYAQLALPVLDARREEVFAGLFTTSGADPRLPVSIVSATSLSQRMQDVGEGLYAAGDGTRLDLGPNPPWAIAREQAHVPSAAILASLGAARLNAEGRDVDTVAPVYLQVSAAEQNLGIRAGV
ncbi:MAG: tRNA (adenosine(37)-N6)-threonylcarbamoyltransferase complex dimerization subunit type 1 TsaB [Deltaproteobacteria bacterium]